MPDLQRAGDSGHSPPAGTNPKGFYWRADLSEWMAVGAWLAVGSFVLFATADLQYQTQFGPGPRFFSVLLSIPLLLFATVRGLQLLARAYRSSTDDPIKAAGEWVSSPRSWLRFAGLVGAIFCYALVLEDIGFLAATAVLMFLCLSLLGRGVQRAGIEAVVATAFLFLLFRVFLGVQLPVSQIPALRSFGL